MRANVRVPFCNEHPAIRHPVEPRNGLLPAYPHTRAADRRTTNRFDESYKRGCEEKILPLPLLVETDVVACIQPNLSSGDAPRPDPDTPAPPRFLPVFDNLLLAHADRRRILSEARRKMLFGTAALLEGTILIDRFVGARWKIAQQRGRAVLTVEPFVSLRNRDRKAICEEGIGLLRFALPAAETQEIRFATLCAA